MDVSFYTPLQGSQQYSASFEAYKDNSEENEKISGWICSHEFDEISESLLRRFPGVSTLRILGVGSGDGTFDIQIVRQLLRRFPSVVCTVVEPSQDRIERYQRLAKESNDLDGVTFEWRQEYFDQFYDQVASRYHFFSCIHSCYFMERQQLEGHLLKMTGHLHAGGMGVIMHDAETTCMIRFQKSFPSNSHPLRPTIHAGHIMEALKNLGVSFTPSTIPILCDATKCIDEGSVEGSLLLDFLFQVVGCRENAKKPELLKNIIEFMKSPEVSFEKDGRLYVREPTQVIVISVPA